MEVETVLCTNCGEHDVVQKYSEQWERGMCTTCNENYVHGDKSLPWY